jgi:hypothetical protein
VAFATHHRLKPSHGGSETPTEDEWVTLLPIFGFAAVMLALGARLVRSGLQVRGVELFGVGGVGSSVGGALGTNSGWSLVAIRTAAISLVPVIALSLSLSG